MSVQMTARVWQLALDPTSKMVLLRLADYVNREGCTAWPSVELLAHECCINRRSVQRALRKLELLGLIAPHVPAGRYRSVVYAVHPDKGDKLPPFISQSWAAQSRSMGGTESQAWATLTTPKGGTRPPKPEGTGKVNRKPNRNTPSIPQGGSAERAKRGSRRKRDVDALAAQEGSDARYFAGKYGQRLKAQLDGRKRAAAFKARPA